MPLVTLIFFSEKNYLFDLIRKCGGRQGLKRNDYRGATANTENRIPLQRLQGQSGQEQTSCTIQQIASILQHTTKRVR